MFSHLFVYVLFVFSTSCYFFAVQLPSSRDRYFLTSLHVGTNIGFLLTARRCWGRELAAMAMPFFLLGLLHTTSSLCIHQMVLRLTGPHWTLRRRIRAVYRVWNNPRGLCLNKNSSSSSSALSRPQRVHYSLRKGATVAAVWVANRGVTAVTEQGYRFFHVTVFDFLPPLAEQPQEKFCAWPWSFFWSWLSPQAFYVRAIFAVQWIWFSYVRLMAAHGVLAVVFVGVLGWDAPNEWPPLFGDLRQATSLRRFWGRFWHRLHTQSFAAFSPPFNSKVLRALWIFLASAAYHATINWLVFGRTNAAHEVAFFLLNFCVCLGETAVAHVGRNRHLVLLSSSSSVALYYSLRLCGYSWVCLMLLCLAVPWQTSLVRASLI